MTFMQNGLHSVVVDHDKCIKCKKCVACCPANREMMEKDYFEGLQSCRYYLGYNKDKSIRRMSSSGGVCKTIIIESLKRGFVDGVYTLKKLPLYPSGEGEFYTKENIPEYDEIANSVYHSVMIGTNLHKVQKCDRLMIVGTSCQLRAMEVTLKGKYKELIKICIFCKQQKTLDSTRFLAKAMGTKVPERLNFATRYRGDGWPGIVRVGEAELPWNRAAQLPFGRRLWTVPGCNVCGDPFGKETNADITLMDPWKIREQNDLGETLTIVHTDNGYGILKGIDALTLESKSFDEVVLALDLKDIFRKRKLVPYFMKDKCSSKIKWAGRMEQIQRFYLRKTAELLPRMPILFYRIMCKIPDLRNIILK